MYRKMTSSVKKWGHFLSLFLVSKDENFAENIIQHDNQNLCQEGFDGIDHGDIIADKLSDEAWETRYKDKGQSHI